MTAALVEHGLLLLSDAHLPSVASIVAGEPVRGSWWGHARSHAIFNTAEALEEREDVTTAKLVSGKVTFVHRRLWPALVAVGASREPWQTERLVPTPRRILEAVETKGSARTDALAIALKLPSKAVAKAALDLEKRLLVHSTEIHTESGAHAKELEGWDIWARRAAVTTGALTPGEGKRALERAVAALVGQFEGNGALAWQARARSRP